MGGRDGESSTANHPVLRWPGTAARPSLGWLAVTAFCHIKDTRKRTRTAHTQTSLGGVRALWALEGEKVAVASSRLGVGVTTTRRLRGSKGLAGRESDQDGDSAGDPGAFFQGRPWLTLPRRNIIASPQMAIIAARKSG